MGRALPSLAVIAILIGLVGLGFLNVLIALVVLAVPPILTNAYVADRPVDRDAVERRAGDGDDPSWRCSGASSCPWRCPCCSRASAPRRSTWSPPPRWARSPATAGGLGDIIANQASYQLSGVLGAAICVALLALAVDGLFAALQRLVTPRGLRARVDSVRRADRARRPPRPHLPK